MKKLLFAFIVVVLIAATATAVQQSEQPSGSIKGRVTVDGKAQPGVLVSLSKADNMDYDRRLLAKTFTDAGGNYRFTEIAAGRYSVSAYSPLLVNPEIDRNGFSGRGINVDAGEAVEEINFALSRGGVITGRVTDTEGRPVISQGVALFKMEGGRITHLFHALDPQVMLTDDRGVYRIYGVLPGSYLIRVGSSGVNRATPGGRRSNYLQTYYPGVSDQVKATLVEVTAGGEATGIDIKVGLLKKTYTARGRMVDAETGRPVANLWYGITLGEDTRPSPSGGYRTNANGEFQIELSVPGRVTIHPSADSESNTVGDPFSFDLTSERVTGLEIKLRRAQTMSGIIVFEGATSIAPAPKLSDLRLIVRCIAPGDKPYHGVRAKIREDGSFSAGGIIPGKAIIFLETSDGTKQRPWVMQIERNGVSQNRGIEIAEGEIISDLRVVVAYGNGIVRGQVQTEGRTFDTRKIYVSFRHTSVPRLAGGIEIDARGRFMINGLPDGVYEIMPETDFTDDDAGRDLRSRFAAAKQTITIMNGAETPVTLLVNLSEKK